MKTTVIQIT